MYYKCTHQQSVIIILYIIAQLCFVGKDYLQLLWLLWCPLFFFHSNDTWVIYMDRAWVSSRDKNKEATASCDSMLAMPMISNSHMTFVISVSIIVQREELLGAQCLPKMTTVNFRSVIGQHNIERRFLAILIGWFKLTNQKMRKPGLLSS